MARSPEKARLLEVLSAAPVEVDLFDAPALREAIAGSGAVVNLATKIPSVAKMMMPGAWSENDRIRTVASRNLVDAALAAGATHYIQESLAFMYPDRGDDWIDEDVTPDPPSYARTVLDAEAQVRRFTDAGGAGVILRFGQFYAADANHTIAMAAMARKGMSPFLGPRDAFAVEVHAEDVGSAVAAALKAPAGVYNVCDSDPARQWELAEAIGEALGGKKLRFPPRAVGKLSGGAARMLQRSERVSNERFRNATGWEPRYPDSRVGMAEVFQEVK